MAKAYLNANPPYVIVEKGDTLSAIARDYKSASGGATYKQLAAINDIKNADLIYIGQKIYLSEDITVSPPTLLTSANSNQAIIEQFGYQSNSSNVLFATWSWDRANTKDYEVDWTYDTGNSVWFEGSKGTTEHKYSTYSVPSNAKRVRFRVKPVSTTYTSNGKETSHWTADWSTYKLCTVTDVLPPSKPPTPTVKIDKYTLTATVENLSSDIQSVNFVIVRDNDWIIKNYHISVMKNQFGEPTGHASCSCTIKAGHKYKVRCRSFNPVGYVYSEWSDYSDYYYTAPATPSGFTTIRANSETSVYLEWNKDDNADTYNIEYATKKQYFDGSDQVTSITGIKTTSYEKTGLETGQEYFFRLQAINEQGESGWSEIKSVVIGKKPSAPTTWSSTTTAIVGEELTLYWVHNAEDGSSQKHAELELSINGNTTTKTIQNSADEDEKDKISYYVINTSAYIEGTTIKWRVRTAGITNTYGDWSIQRTVDIYAPATLELHLIDGSGNNIDTLESFPVYVSGLAGPKSQLPIGYHLSVVSNETYDTVDRVGNKTIVNAGQEVYSKYFDITDSLMVELSAGNIDLENNISYTVNCTVSMNSGLTAEASLPFVVSWTEVAYTPNARISLDEETYVTHISPFCWSNRAVKYRVTYSNNIFTKTSTVVDRVYGDPVKNRFTTTGEQVCKGVMPNGHEIYYCYVVESESIKGVTLSVYRREFDGRFTELATGLVNGNDTFVTDPHPALDYARYRIVAVTNSTGAVSYCDLPGYPVGGKAAIIQWDEVWTNFDTTTESALEDPAWSGSMLKLPYNIDVSDSGAPDVELVEYIGRDHPVGYYGTQRGLTSTWNVEIEADDKETLYAIRRLQNWMGNAYVREPSGSGYWANVKVSFSQKHRTLTIPVTFTITRVEGGV